MDCVNDNQIVIAIQSDLLHKKNMSLLRRTFDDIYSELTECTEAKNSLKMFKEISQPIAYLGNSP